MLHLELCNVACFNIILRPCSIRLSYIFTLVQKVKKGVQNARFCKYSKTLRRLFNLFHLKMTCISCTDGVRVKVPSFQKVTLFLRYEIFHRYVINLRFCLFEDVTDYHDFRRINLKCFVMITPFVFLHNDMRQALLAA